MPTARWSVSRQPELWRYLLRVVALRPILAGLAAALGLALGGFRSSFEQTLAAVLVAAGVSFALDDPAAPTLAASPSPLSWRRATRLALGLPVAVSAWVVVVVTADLLGDVQPPVGLEVAAMTAVSLAAASVAIRRSTDGMGGIAGPPAVLLLALAPFALPARWDLYPVAIHQFRWWMVTAGAVAIVLRCGRDPAASGRPPAATSRFRRR